MEAFCIFMYFFEGGPSPLLDPPPTPPQGRGVECMLALQRKEKKKVPQTLGYLFFKG